jgi:serine/threonine protein kinase/Flp pilus assembly protein TadD
MMGAKTLDEKAIFEVACSIESTEARKDYLGKVCCDNQMLYDRVATLLRVLEEEPDFLESPVPGLGAIIDVPPITEKPGTLIGPYKLIEQIGEGGMGLVFMARQQEPVKRNVALKVIKPGMDSRQVIARFEAERQALALMEHPNIARVLDAGSTESGRPYFVMDLVKGIPITEYCDRERLSTRKRLELFRSVCQAVQHAHQKGIIHRDIKPSNVLVTLHDGMPVPKVIDFGVAKATNRKLTQETLVTGFAQVIGTPLYMSPEQAELGGLDIDTRSDIYSLGVLLYELLTGTTPFEQKKLSEASYDEMRRIIREDEPPKPSTRISTLGEPLATIAEKRNSDSRTLTHQVKGELDWIVMKALEKDRTRRYETANDLAKDVQRYLNSEPVEACPPSTTYRLRKLLRRNKGVAAAITAVTVSLIIGVSVATWQAIRATKAEGVAKQQEQLAFMQKNAAEEAAERERALRTEAECQQARAEANLRLALEALEEVYVRVTQRRHKGGQPKNEEQTLLHSTLKFYQHFADANRATPETWSLVEAMYGKVVTIRRELAEQSPHVVGYRRALAAATVGLASLLESAGRTGEAKETYEQAVRVQEQLVDSFPTVAEYRAELATSRDSLTNLLLSAGQNDRAEKHRAATETVRSVAESATQSEQINSIRFNSFSDPTGLQLFGSTSLADGRLRLTPLAQHCAGAAWTAEKQLVALGFETAFTFRLKGGGGGFAFVIQNHGPSSLGTCGGGQGYGAAYNTDGSGRLISDDRGIPNSLAVEFDTYFNRANDDPAFDHVSVQTNGTDTNSVHHAFSLAAAAAPCDFDDGSVHSVRIRYVPGTLTVFVDGSAEPALSVSVELSAALQLDRGRAWAGFTAGTGNVRHIHEILSWEYRPLVDDDTADSFFRSNPPAAPDTSRPPMATAQEEEDLLSEPEPSPEEFPFLRKALAFYQTFAEQNQDDPNAQWEIGKAYWRIGDIMKTLGDGDNEEWNHEQSEQAYQTAMKIWQTLGDDLPTDAETGQQVALAYCRRAHTCYRRREFEKALQYLKRSVQLDPENAAFLNSLAWKLAACPDAKFRDPQQAVDRAVKAVRLQPDYPPFWNTLGVAQCRAGQWNAAIESLHKAEALASYKGSSFNTFFLAMAYWQIGNRDEARRWYDTAVRWMEQNDPGNEELLRFRTDAAGLMDVTETLREANEETNETTTSDSETKRKGSAKAESVPDSPQASGLSQGKAGPACALGTEGSTVSEAAPT